MMNTVFVSLVSPEEIPADAIDIMRAYQDKHEFFALLINRQKDDRVREMFGLPRVVYLSDRQSPSQSLRLFIRHCYKEAGVKTIIPFRNADDIKKNHNSYLNQLARHITFLPRIATLYAYLLALTLKD